MSQEIKICSAASGCFLGGLSATDTIASEQNLVATCIIKTGGTSGEFLKADGSTDSTSYTSCIGDITGVTTSADYLTGGGTSGSVEVGIDSACTAKWDAGGGGGGLSGTGTAGTITKWTDSGAGVEDSIIVETASLITVAGALDVDRICSMDGSNNIKIGLDACAGGISNVAIGCHAACSTTGGFNNVAIGAGSQKASNSTCCNTGIGVNALCSAGSGGNDNVAIGTDAARLLSTGKCNVAIGYNSSSAGTLSGNNNIGIGSEALDDNAIGFNNIAIGLCSNNANVTGTDNISLGERSMMGNETGSNNVALGSQALFYGLSGDHNFALGQYTLYDNYGGDFNAAIGTAAMQCTTTGSNNAAIGYQAMFNNTTGNDNTAIGECSLKSNVNGIGNTAFGNASLGGNVTGNYNVAVGQGAGKFFADGCTHLSGADDSIYIGRNTRGKDNDDYNSIVIGLSACSCGQNTIKMGNGDITAACVQVAWTTVSDERDKGEITDLDKGLSFIGDLKPKAFKYKESRDSNTTIGQCRYGFLAQDVLATEGKENVIVSDSNPNQLGLNSDYIVPVLVKAIQELEDRIQQLENK